MDDLIPAAEMKNLISGTSDQYWASFRHLGGGPVYVKLGRKVFYRRADVEAWIEANLRTRTDRPVGARGSPQLPDQPAEVRAPRREARESRRSGLRTPFSTASA